MNLPSFKEGSGAFLAEEEGKAGSLLQFPHSSLKVSWVGSAGQVQAEPKGTLGAAEPASLCRVLAGSGVKASPLLSASRVPLH